MSRAHLLLLSFLVLLQLCSAPRGHSHRTRSHTHGRSRHKSHSHSPRLLPGPRQQQPMPQTTDSESPLRLELMMDLSYTNDDPVCPSEGLSGDLLLDVEYSYSTDDTAWAPWERLERLTEAGVVSIPFNVSGEVDLVQFRIVQREHGGGECNCWSINASLIIETLSDRKSINLEAILCYISDPFGTDRQMATFCGGSASIPRGYVVSPISIFSGEPLIDDVTNCMPTDQIILQNCEETQNHIELRFVVSYVDSGATAECNTPNNVDEGIELAIRSPEEPEWVPLAFYGVVNGRRSSSVRITASDLTSQSETINIRGYTVPLIQSFTSDTEQVVRICDKRFLSSNVQFRWLQSAEHLASSDFPRDSWYIANITLAMINGTYNCSTVLQLFNSTTGLFLETPRWGQVSSSECVQLEFDVLLFGGNISESISSRISRTVEVPLDFNCFEALATSVHIAPTPSQTVSSLTSSLVSPSPSPTPQSTLSAELDRIRSAITDDPNLARIQALIFSDPLGGLNELHDAFHEPEFDAETTVVVVLLSDVVDASITSVELTPQQKENLTELFLAFSNDLLEPASESESKPDESEGVAGSSLLVLMDSFGLGSFRSEIENISDTDLNEIDFMVQELPQTQNRRVQGIEGDGYSISIPPEAFNRAPVNVASYYYRNMSSLLPANLSNIAIVANGSIRLISPVVSSALQCGDQDCGTDALNEPVIIEFTHPPELIKEIESGDAEVHCAFWNFSSQVGPLAEGEWSTDGCERDNVSSSATRTVCLCYHLTHFGVLLSTGPPLSEAVTLSLQIIGYIGVTVSLVCLSLTAMTFIVLRSLWNMRNYIHVNLCISLIISQLTFVIGIDKTGNRVGCQVVAVLLHYFFLVSFMWMLMEGVVLYVSLVKVFVKHKTRYIAAFTIASYGLPLLYMGLCIPLGFLLWKDGRVGYGYEEACWLRYDVHFIWAFNIPCILIIICNFGFFIMALTIMYRHQKRQTHTSRVATAKHWMKVAVSLVLVMGLTWIIGVVQFHEALQLAVSYLFTIFIGLQGVLIFILFVPLSKQVREAFSKWWKMKVNESDFLSKHFGDKSFASNTATTAVRTTSPTSRAYSIANREALRLEDGMSIVTPTHVTTANRNSVFNVVFQSMDNNLELPHDINGTAVESNINPDEEPAEVYESSEEADWSEAEPNSDHD